MDRLDKIRIRMSIICLILILLILLWWEIPLAYASEEDRVQVTTGPAIGVVTGSATTFLPEEGSSSVSGPSIAIKPSDTTEGTEEETTDGDEKDELLDEEDEEEEITEEEEPEVPQPDSEEMPDEVIGSSYTVSIPKTMVFTRPGSSTGASTWNQSRVTYTITVKATMATGSAIYVIPADSFVFSQEGKSDRIASVYQEQTVFEHSNEISSEELEAGVIVDGVIILPNMTAGVWEGYLTFDIFCTEKMEEDASESEETAVEEPVIEENDAIEEPGKEEVESPDTTEDGETQEFEKEDETIDTILPSEEENELLMEEGKGDEIP